MGIFDGINFVFNTHATFAQDPVDLANEVVKEGGVIHKHITKTTFADGVGYLISPVDNGTMKVTQANKLQVPIVTEHFIIDSLRLKQLQSASAYALSPIVDKPINIPKPSKPTNSAPFHVSIRNLDTMTAYPITEELTPLGRGPFLEIQEKKMSRKQVELRTDSKNRRVFITSYGVNPSMLKRSGDSEAVAMEKEQEYELHEKDCFYLLLQEFGYKLEFTEQPIKKKILLEEEDEEIKEPVKRKVEEEVTSTKKVKTPSLPQAGKITDFFSSKSIEKNEEDEGFYSIGFPSISTNMFQFDIHKATQVVQKVFSSFLGKYSHPRIRLYLPDISESDTLKAFRRIKINDKRFCVEVADLTKMKSCGYPVRFIVNAANSSFFPKGSGINRAVHEAAPELNKLTKALYKSAETGKAYPVELPMTSPLRKKEGVQYVIHVVGPNMNPERPDCLKGDYETGCKLLEESYTSFLEFYAEKLGLGSKSEDSFEDDLDAQINKFKGNKTTPVAKPVAAPIATGAWSSALIDYIQHPERHAEDIHYQDSQLIAIRDKYPKAQHHLLVMPKENLRNFSQLNKDHVPLLLEMKKRGETIVKELTEKSSKKLSFRLGFHKVPSMSQVHMHVISQDFNSDHLKNKKHWNSFTTEFFIDADDFINILKKEGSVGFDKHSNEALLKGDLHCHKCKAEMSNIPKLKAHIATCTNK